MTRIRRKRAWRRVVRFWTRPRNWRWLFALRTVIASAQQNQDLDADSPLLVMLTDKSAELLTHAQALAADNRDDSNAVIELIELAHGDVNALKLAALAARQGGEHHESFRANLSHRLLQAALANGPVEGLLDKDRARLLAVDKFAESPFCQQWQELVRREPRLTALRLDDHEQGGGDRHLLRSKLREQLVVLVGPDSSSVDVIVRSRHALHVALTFLMEDVARTSRLSD